MTKHSILVVFPNSWDRKQFQACRDAWCDHYELIFTEPTDEDCAWDFDVVRFIDEMVTTWKGRIHGVTSSSDYPGATVAGAIATRLGLPGSPPHRVIGTSHKYYSRLIQRDAAPDATPEFELVDPHDPNPRLRTLTYPCFIKPVKGAFSVMAGRLETEADLTAFLRRPAVAEFIVNYVHIFNQLVTSLTDYEINGSYFLAEELLHGRLTTVEGFVHHGEVNVIGIVDSITHPDTKSFIRFDYPSALPAPLQQRMVDLARLVIGALKLDHSFFNIEMIYDEATDRLGIIEVNPRICGQFADLYQKVDGTSTYELALALAVGQPPALQRGAGQYAAASSYPLRIFQPMRVINAPDDRRVAEIQTAFAGTLVWLECTAGQALADFESLEDGTSYRYGIVNLGGDSPADVQTRFNRIVDELGFRMEPV